MTRINCVDPHELVDKHLLAEYRELPRLRNAYPRKAVPIIPDRYCLGKGHVTFFFDKGQYLVGRHKLIVEEMKRRGFVVNYPNLDLSHWPSDAMNNWQPDSHAISTNRQRIADRLAGNKGD